MSSLVERLRVRSERRPRYALDESDDDLPLRVGAGKGKDQQNDAPAERIEREDAKEEACQRCGKSDNLVSCSTCTYKFHRKCLVPCLNITSDKWSCPECVSPLTEMERILDIEVLEAPREDSSSTEPRSKKMERYLIKWKGLSYIHCSWVSEKEYSEAANIHPRLRTRLNNFRRQKEAMKIEAERSGEDIVAIRPEWTTVDRILASRKNLVGDREYYVKWNELTYEECTWENESDITVFQPEIERFNEIQFRRKKSGDKGKATREPRQFKESPTFLSGGTLHPYQLEGLNFLRYSWFHNKRVILGDEMGLGKTIQSIAFLASLFEDKFGPHLVVAPLSTLRNWEREFATWAPQMNVVMYFGAAASRDIIRKYEFYYPKEKLKKLKKKKSSPSNEDKKQSRIRFDVLLTSYEMINMDSSILKNIEWECLVVDEGHRLKNKDSKLFGQLKDYNTKHRVLLTGTPVQNNLDELFMLMHFLEGESFGSITDLQEEFKDINQDKQIEKLHGMLKPHLLRRFKKDVMKELPPKKELILRVELTRKQKEYYKAILTKNYEVLARRNGGHTSLINVVMELRKLCCHGFMIDEPDLEPANPEEGLRRLLDSSGKMQLLDKMMVKLKEQGHRVLIYSQFQHMLDLLEDYLSYRKWTYERIDGKISGADRQIRIDRFNAKNSTRFCFLLSTRAGGLGINLATADTVIIYDSDWNPHADLQAMARAHRLGQTSKVMIYRLVSRGTIEERMMQLTKKKILLEHLVVGRLTKANNVNQEELDDIIRYGSKELFEDENDESRQIHYDEAAIERLLDRDQVDGDESVEDEEEDGFLKGFKVANFEYIDEAKAQAEKEEARRKAAAEAENSERNYWDELLKDRYDVQKVEEHTAMGKGKRSRKQMAAADEDDIHDLSSEDEDYSLEDDISDNDTSLQGNISGKRGQYSKRKSRNVDSIPLMEGEGRTLRVLGFNHAQRAMFLQTLNRFGFQNYDWKEYLPRLKGKSVEEIQRYAELVMAHLVEEINDSDYFSDGVPKEMMRVDDVLVRIANISLIEEKMAATGPGKITNIFPNYLLYEFQGLSGGRIWKAEHDLLLLRGILKHGYARWQYISDDRENGLFEAARRELHLPSVNEIIGAQLNEANGNLEGAQEGQANTTSMSHYKEIQRKIVEFLRKRYHLMERALNMEYAVIKKKIPVPDDITEQGVPAGHAPFIPDISELLRELPNLEPISTNELVSEGTAGQLQVPHLYNKMCGVLEESGAYALSSFFGDKSASSSLANSLRQFETVCENVVEALRPHQNGTGSAIKEELVDAATKAAAAAAPQQDSGHDAPHGQSSTAKADMEIDG
ncbi:CHD3-type chromatin-remodeling factor PICKLE [Zea mays]|uniref:CHD3-type chromatin-remodeling factor PICKLE n=2 Tax=Zea mays TaxID=4577 RepID=A0A8J8YN73_MAIZE|nr:CHD3-type chromatin-remodeling factor PICKLE isoform X1 [Zea mays]AQL01564.1 Putative homeodomain-like transcription factor superfamily protein [Zea mays]PWZ05246.1 CHD3-type chromatin-remodeling factor PICKLE [Zea mays]|eukprot:XP_008659201.1 CHD3-type chromatin-remodeling factor PICKLE isoform X1 [Zea mays]